MPDTREFQNIALGTYSNASPVNHNLEESMRRLKIEDIYENADPNANIYPDRPGEPDCIYYMKTGSCGYGSYCRYNHPTHVRQGTQTRVELPERTGQPDCQYFLRTGTCKFGPTCKYHHPRDRQDARAVQYNIFGFPMRQDEKSCSYYLRTGTCKFGVACKFDHPQPATVSALYPLTGSSAYGSTLSSVTQAPSLSLAGGISAWPLSSRPPYQCLPAYMPVILPAAPGAIPSQQGWTTYTGAASQAPTSDSFSLGHTPMSKNNTYPSSSSLENFPERPDQPECQYYLKTGSCRYGPTCKYHHPRERISAAASLLGPHGLPLRSGLAVCSFYSMYGSCKFGSGCRFDHPLMSYYNYALPAISVQDHLSMFTTHRTPLESSPYIMKSEARGDEALPSDSVPIKLANSSDSQLNQSD